jgi:hypothetical protein
VISEVPASTGQKERRRRKERKKDKVPAVAIRVNKFD